MKPPRISDEEIESYMDFDVLVSKIESETIWKAKMLSAFRSKGKIVAGFTAALIVTCLYWYITYGPRPENTTPKQAPKQSRSTQLGVDTLSLKHDSSKSDDNTNFTQKDSVVHHSGNQKSRNVNQINGVGQNKTPQPATNVSPPVSSVTEYLQAEPIDGYPELYKFFHNELQYPKEMLKDSVEGVVVVLFTISKEGKPQNIAIEQSLGTAFDEEAVRLIRAMPLWRPATYNGKPVASRLSIPLTFNID